MITLEKEDAAESAATTAAAVAASSTARGKTKRVQSGRGGSDSGNGAGGSGNGGLPNTAPPKARARSKKKWGSGNTLGDGGTLAAAVGDGAAGEAAVVAADRASPGAKRKAESELEGQAARARAAVAAQDEEAKQIEEALYMSKKYATPIARGSAYWRACVRACVLARTGLLLRVYFGGNWAHSLSPPQSPLLYAGYYLL